MLFLILYLLWFLCGDCVVFFFDESFGDYMNDYFVFLFFLEGCMVVVIGGSLGIGCGIVIVFVRVGVVIVVVVWGEDCVGEIVDELCGFGC